MSAPLPAIFRAIMGILYDRPYAVPPRSIAQVLGETKEKEGFAVALGKYAGMVARPDEYVLDEGEMNGLGYALLREGNAKDAIEIFKLNVAAFPKSANVYDSLGEAYAGAGDRELAIRNYEQSLALNPSNTGAVEALKKLKEPAPK